MTCHDCQQRLQARLDGEAVPADEVAAHLAACRDCRALAAAARRLRAGLALLTPPAPPPGLADRIASGVLADRRRRRLRRIAFTGVAALAASLLLAAVALWGRGRPPEPEPRTVIAEAPPPPSLDENVAEATSAVASLARRTADETVGSGQVLVPAVTLPMPTEEVLGPPLDPPAESLREAGHGVATGLQPVADGAQRWLNLLRRDMTAVTPDGKSGF